MNSELDKPVAGRVAEHNFWLAERRYSTGLDTVGSGDLWDPGIRTREDTVLRDILTPERIKISLVGATSREVVKELIDLLVGAGDLSDGDEVLAAIVSREQTKSTGIGGALAIPHAKTSQVSDLIMAVGVCAEPVDFGSIDGLGVRLVVMLICPEEMTAQHRRVLNRVTALMSVVSVRDQLLEAGSSDALYEVIRRHESNLDNSGDIDLVAASRSKNQSTDPTSRPVD